MNSRPAILLLTSRSSTGEASAYQRRFAQHGYVMTVCAGLADLLQHVEAIATKGHVRVVTVIDGNRTDYTTVISALRALHAQAAIVGLVDRNDDELMARVLHDGVDTCSIAGVPDLLVAVVLRLLWRLDVMQPVLAMVTEGSSAPVPRVPGSARGSWRLIDQGWTVSSPLGVCVALTTGERAFLMTLLAAPAQKATHEALITAVNTVYSQPIGQPVRQSRLGVMVSRMRRKFERAGAPLPLKSVHNWGYMFVDDA